MREALRAIYLKNDSSRFQFLLGFTNVQLADIVDQDELRLRLDDIAVNEENGLCDTKDKILKNEDIHQTNVTKIEESASLSEDKDDIKKKNCADTTLFLRKSGRTRYSLQCAKCGKKFRYGTAFRRHKIKKHREKEEDLEKDWEALQENFQCPCKICGKKFFSRHNMKEHRRKEHPMERIIDEKEATKNLEEPRGLAK